MKKTEKKKPVPTIPQGVWEGSHTDQSDGKAKNPVSPGTDLQGNGYPNNASGMPAATGSSGEPELSGDARLSGNTEKLSATAKTFWDTHKNVSRD